MKVYEADIWIKPDENITITRHVHKEMESEHNHNFIEIAYIFCGEGYQEINGVSGSVKKGDILFFNFCDRHSFYPKGNLGVLNCLIKPEFISNELVNCENAMDILALTSFKDFSGYLGNFDPILSLKGKELVEVENLFDNMEEEFNKKQDGYTTALKGYLNILLVKIFRHVKNSGSSFIYNAVQKVAPDILEYIEKNYNKKISLESLAQQSFYNPSYFSIVFKECFGITITGYINEKRVKSAMKYLSETGLSIEKVALLVGFNNKNQFYKIFKEHTGLTPSEYRGNSANIR